MGWLDYNEGQCSKGATLFCKERVWGSIPPGFHIWADSSNGNTPVLHAGIRGSNPLRSTKHSIATNAEYGRNGRYVKLTDPMHAGV